MPKLHSSCQRRLRLQETFPNNQRKAPMANDLCGQSFGREDSKNGPTISHDTLPFSHAGNRQTRQAASFVTSPVVPFSPRMSGDGRRHGHTNFQFTVLPPPSSLLPPHKLGFFSFEKAGAAVQRDKNTVTAGAVTTSHYSAPLPDGTFPGGKMSFPPVWSSQL